MTSDDCSRAQARAQAQAQAQVKVAVFGHRGMYGWPCLHPKQKKKEHVEFRNRKKGAGKGWAMEQVLGSATRTGCCPSFFATTFRFQQCSGMSYGSAWIGLAWSGCWVDKDLDRLPG